jgi:hypothetical protein
VGTLCVVQGGADIASGSHISSGSCVPQGRHDGGMVAGNPLLTMSSRAVIPPKPVRYFPWHDYFVPVFFQAFFWIFLTLCTVAMDFFLFFWLSYWGCVFCDDVAVLVPIFWSGFALIVIGFCIFFPFRVMPIYRVAISRDDTQPHPNWSFSLIFLLEGFLSFPLLFFGGTEFMRIVYNSWGAQFAEGVYIDSPFLFDVWRLKHSVVLGVVDPHAPGQTAWSMQFGFLKLGEFSVLDRLATVSLQLETAPHVLIRSLSRVLIGDVPDRAQIMQGSPARRVTRQQQLEFMKPVTLSANAKVCSECHAEKDPVWSLGELEPRLLCRECSEIAQSTAAPAASLAALQSLRGRGGTVSDPQDDAVELRVFMGGVAEQSDGAAALPFNKDKEEADAAQ